MAFNPFKTKPPVEKPNRNAFDLSFANNLTLEFGKLYPVFAKECLPGDTFRIKPTFGFRFMPMYFPVQSRMRADLKFFYVRNRNLWDNWKKFIGQTDRVQGQTVVPPYLDITESNVHRLATGSLLDYLGVPTTAPQMVSIEQNIPIGGNSSSSISDVPDTITGIETGIGSSPVVSYLSGLGPNWLSWDSFTSLQSPFGGVDFNADDYHLASISLTPLKGWNSRVAPEIKAYYRDLMNTSSQSIFQRQIDTSGKAFVCVFRSGSGQALISENESGFTHTEFTFGYQASLVQGNGYVTIQLGSSLINEEKVLSRGTIDYQNFIESLDFETNNYYIAIFLPYNQSEMIQQYSDENGNKVDGLRVVFPYMLSIQTEGQYNQDIGVQSPFIHRDGSDSPVVKLSALLPRAYEAICNTDFYRNVEVDPFRIGTPQQNYVPTGNEPPEYDKFIPNSSDGADSFPYDFHYKYWEDDFLTDAMPTPQMGIAPLVGGRPAENISLMRARILSDANSVGDDLSVNVDRETGQVLSVHNYTGNDLEMLEEAISYGISINDFRNVNALQKWLEKNVRRGYRYKDQMMSHFGVHLSYEECDMPEYIGGFSEDVDVRAISQSVGTADAPLGSLAGQASCVGSSKHEIDKYTDEHGFIIGILCITPIPTYSQLLPKHWTKENALDYFTPEFGHIGYQAIPVKEVTPLNVVLANSGNTFAQLVGKMEETFGYQRAWYDYLSSTDEVHGEFRTTMRDYLVDRVFDGVPKLSKEFLEVNPKEVNDIFNYTGSDDKIVGQMWFDTTVVRPIPKYGIPKLD